MKRLLRIALNFAIISIFQILSWFVLSITLSADLINVFAITYPLQFAWSLLVSIFATGANINAQKSKNDNIIYSSMAIVAVVAAVIYAVVALFAKAYLEFMNVDPKTYYEFTIYFIVLQYFNVILYTVLEKLYFEEKEKKANIICVSYEILIFVLLCGLSIFIKNYWIIIAVTLAGAGIFSIIVFLASFKRFKLTFKLLGNIKFESAKICNSILFLIIYIFGFSNTFSYGEQYITAMTLVSLVVDMQWDAMSAVKTAANVDISKGAGTFNYKVHRKNALCLALILAVSSLVMYFAAFSTYNVNVFLGLSYLVIDVVDYFFDAIISIKQSYLQIEHSQIAVSTIVIISMTIRCFLSFLPTPYCTYIGQIFDSIFKIVSFSIILSRAFKITKEGIIEKKGRFL